MLLLGTYEILLVMRKGLLQCPCRYRLARPVGQISQAYFSVQASKCFDFDENNARWSFARNMQRGGVLH